MKLISIYTPDQSELKDKWFLPSVKDNIEIEILLFESHGNTKSPEPCGNEQALFKSRAIIQSIRDNPGGILIYSDVDTEFFRPFKKIILSSLESKDIVCVLDEPYGALSTGFFALRANRLNLQLWEQVHEAVLKGYSIQAALNLVIQEVKELQSGYLPVEFFSAGTFRLKNRSPWGQIHIPDLPVMFHTYPGISLRKKKFLLRYVKSIVQLGRVGIQTNNLICKLLNPGKDNPAIARSFIAEFNSRAIGKKSSFSRPRKVGIDASTVCQLACRTCPTSRGLIRETLGSGFLSCHHFEKFLQAHPWITEIELSNWGEVFLNPDLKDIFKLAEKYFVILRVDNGANLNKVSDEVLEDLVRYKIRSITCSIDGASQETYSNYRLKGDFEKVIDNIKKINRFKEIYHSPFPFLLWQFVAFGHNEHEIDKARQLAGDLHMKFNLKLSWEDLYFESFSPVNDRDRIRSEMPSGVSDRSEYEEKFHKVYIGDCCKHIWQSPRINYDGRLLGCCINYWDDFGNVFEQGIEACLNSDKMKATRDLLMGHNTDRKDLHCFKCNVYKSRVKLGSFVTLQDLKEHS
jgi:MoaA/NifB/PqqE/SkfB family radical SAM enzyme